MAFSVRSEAVDAFLVSASAVLPSAPAAGFEPAPMRKIFLLISVR